MKQRKPARKTTAPVVGKRRGRPRELPSQVPRLDRSAALDPDLIDRTPVAASVAVDAARATARQAKQEQRAKEISRARGARQIQEMATAAQAARIRSERRIKRMVEKESEKLVESRRIYELHLAQLAGETLVVDERTQNLLDNYGRVTRPRVSPAEHAVMAALRGRMTQKEVAQEVGVSPSTVSRHYNGKFGRGNGQRGRPPVLNDIQIHAAARFLFLNKTLGLLQAVQFLHEAFKVKVSTVTLSRHLKITVGFRLGDFRRFPRDRNIEEIIEERYKYAKRMPNKYGPTTLCDALYYDEMKLSRQTTRNAWSICGWIPTVPDEFACKDAEHITLLYCASPQLGTINWHIVEGSVDADVVKEFLEEVVRVYAMSHHGEPIRAFIMDNVNIHHAEEIENGIFASAVSNLLGVEFMPRYSPFLNPIEEVFARLKFNLAKKRSLSDETNESKAFIKKALAEEIETIKPRDVMGYFLHISHFLELALQRAPVFTQQHFEHSHEGDEIAQCPILPENIERLLDRYLPDSYSRFTPEARRATEAVFGAQTVTRDVALSFSEHPDGTANFLL